MICCNRDTSWGSAFFRRKEWETGSDSGTSQKKGRERSSALLHAGAGAGGERTRLLNTTDDLGRTLTCVDAEREHHHLADSGAGGAIQQTPGDDGETALLFVACQEGHLEMCRFSLKKGADPNAKDVYGNTPLMFAASEGHARICEALLDAGADPDLADEDGVTPLFAACQEERTEVCKLLVGRGADCSISPCNLTPGMWAALFSRDRELAAVLLVPGACTVVDPDDDVRNLELSKERRIRIRGMRGEPIPPRFLCAVTGRLLVHPVIAGGGDSRVERYVAERHISLVGTDPISGRPTTLSELRDDLELFAL